MQIQTETKTKNIEIQITTVGTVTTRTIDTIIVAINKTTDTTTIAIQQINSKTEITQTNNHVDIVIEQITNQGIVRPVLIAEDWDTCLANVEHLDKIKTIVNKIQMSIKIHEIIIKTAMQIPHSNKIL